MTDIPLVKLIQHLKNADPNKNHPLFYVRRGRLVGGRKNEGRLRGIYSQINFVNALSVPSNCSTDCS
jgi:hypothetical protein